MPEITCTQAKEFLNKITAKDKVAIIHHDDADGYCSGILYYDWCKNKKTTTKQFTYSIQKTKLKNLDLKIFNKIIVCDLSSGFMAEELELIKDKQVFYTDHHPRFPLPKEILELPTTKLGYIPSSRTAGELTNLKPWLSLIGTIADAGELYPENTDFINDHLKQLNTTFDSFKENITSVVTNFLVYFNDDNEKSFKILQKINSVEKISKLKKYSEPIENEIQKFVEEYETKKEKLGHINFYFFKPHFSIKSIVVGVLSNKNHNEIYIFASPKNENITFAARTNDRKINVIKIMQAGIKNLKNANAGGHPAAAGGIIQAEDLKQFKQNIRDFTKT